MSGKEVKMGKTYMKTIESIMKQYEKLWIKATKEWERFGEISKDTDIALERLEAKLALMDA